MQRAYSYIRFSSEKQRKGDSIRRQVEARDEWLEANKTKVVLDKKEFKDFGLSGHYGANLDEDVGQLGNFIACCRAGLIEPNSYLIVERIDRFSRQSADIVLSIFSQLVREHHLIIVLCKPTTVEIDKDSIADTGNLMRLVIEMQLAYEESLKKAQNVSKAWTKKKKLAQDGVILTKHLPAWLYYDDKNGQITVNKSKKITINKIFDWSINGMGCQKIIKRLVEEEIKPITEPTKRNPDPSWTMSYVSQLLNDRRLIGEMQPKTKKGNSFRKIDGKAIKNYFPAVITEQKFNKNIIQKKIRKNFKVVPKRKFVNTLVGLVHCKSDGRKMTAQTRTKYSKKLGKTKKTQYLISTGRRNVRKGNVAYCPISLDYDSFETLIEHIVQELKPKDLVQKKKEKKEVQEIIVNIEATKERLSEIKKKISDPKYTSQIDFLLDMKMETEMKLADYEKEKENCINTDSSSSPAELYKELKKLVASKEGTIEIRERYRALLPSFVERIDVTPARTGKKCIGYGTVKLTSGIIRPFILIDTPIGTDDQKGIAMTVQKRPQHSDNKRRVTAAIRINDQKKNPILSITEQGIFGQYGAKKPELDKWTANRLEEVDAIFRQATFHGKSTWPGIEQHLFDNN